MTDLTKMLEAAMAGSGFVRSTGMRALHVAPGDVRLAVDRQPGLLQFNGHFHGGVIAGIADHAAGGAVSTLLAKDRRIAVTLDLNVNYLAPADGETLVATAKVVRAGKVIGVARVDVASLKDGKETICAIATATLRAVDMPGRAA